MKRRPNGAGTIRKFTGNRVEPYAAFTPIEIIGGKSKRQCIGYFSSYEEAEEALVYWRKRRGTKINYTFLELYEEWQIKGFKNISKSTIDCYKAAWKQMANLQRFKVSTIRTGHFQDVIDSMATTGKSWSSMHNVKVLASMLQKYAMQYDIIEKNYAEFIVLPQKEKEEREIFTDEQLNSIEQAAEDGNKTARLIVILCYTGWRVTEFLNLTAADYDPINKTFKGGLKTENGKDRIVPVQPHIQGYVDELLAMNGPRLVCREVEKGRSPQKYTMLEPITANYFRKYMFGTTLESLGIRRSDGEQFTPHVTRHTFATVCRKKGVDPLVTKKLMGHSPKADVTEKVYTHIDFDMLNRGISMLKSQKEKSNKQH